jgi:hypothetical protein
MYFSQAIRLDPQNAEAQCMMGVMYHVGHGVPQDYIEAVRWYRKAADQGYAHAQNNLGAMYYEGHGVPEDDAEAVKWYRKAADQSYASAQHNLGCMYREGQGVPQDDAEAEKWFAFASWFEANPWYHEDKGMQKVADRLAETLRDEAEVKTGKPLLGVLLLKAVREEIEKRFPEKFS